MAEEGIEVPDGSGESADKKATVSRATSNLNVSDDPFAQREGKTLLWRDVKMVLVSVGKCRQVLAYFLHYVSVMVVCTICR